MEEEKTRSKNEVERLIKSQDDVQIKIVELELSLVDSRVETDTAKRELMDYRLKALKILQVSICSFVRLRQ